jgi:PBP1b-binding outer membrane lipoprotein LpoB
MKKLLILILVMSLALMFVGCSDDDDGTPAVTKASFKNHTNADVNVFIDGIDGTLVAGETWDYTFDNAIFVDEDVLTLNYTI